MIADDFFKCVVKGIHYLKKAVIQWYKLFRKLKILFINKQNEITHSGCKRIIFMQ